MKNKSVYDEIFDKPCSVCGKIIKKDVYDQGDCPHCTFKNIDDFKENAKVEEDFLKDIWDETTDRYWLQ